MKYYEMLVAQRDALEKKVKDGRSLDASSLDILAINRAVRFCMEKQRYFYLGPQEAQPNYPQLQTANTRYIATWLDGTAIIIELTRGEFPEVFEHYDRR